MVALLIGGTIYLGGKTLIRIVTRGHQVAADCNQIEQALQNTNLEVLRREFASGVILYDKEIAITPKRAMEIADLMAQSTKEMEVDLKTSEVKDLYAKYLTTWKTHIEKIREWAKSPHKINGYSQLEWIGGYENFHAGVILANLCMWEK